MLLKVSVVAVLLGIPQLVVAANALTGTGAAHIDWTVKNCGAKSTDKEHQLVDAATAVARDKFQADYFKEIAGPKLTKALERKSDTEALCAEMRQWYGPSVSRVAGLLAWSKESPSADGSSPKSAGSSGKGGGRRHGRSGDTGTPQ